MKYYQYSKGSDTGYQGWIENENGEAIAFIKDNGDVVTQW